MVYLKTIFSAPNEIKFIKLSLSEAAGHIDRFIVCEFNRTHTGEARELIFKNYLDQFTKAEQEKIVYIGADIAKETVSAQDNSRLAHRNEKLMRGYFARQTKLRPWDIVFSVDADEVIYGENYEAIKAQLKPWRPALKLRLHQFFYRLNYLWENNDFIAPTACYAWYYLWRYPGQWRYAGRLYKPIAGAHFSWCLSTEEMIAKLKMYAHRQEYGHLAEPAILEKAVSDKSYPFDPRTDFRIKVLDLEKDKQYFPPALYSNLEFFPHLIAKD